MSNTPVNDTSERSVVFIIDDDPSVRAAIEDLLRSVDLNVQSFGSPSDFLKSAWPDAAACLILDVRMPGLSGLDFQREMARLKIEFPVIFITAHGDIPMSVRAMKAGAIEFLSKPFRDQDLLDAIHAGLEKDRTRRRDAAAINQLRARLDRLSAGEREVLTLVVNGRLNKQIADELKLSEIAIKVRRASLMRKMEARSLAELVRMAERLGISRDAGDQNNGAGAQGRSP
jgi:FixJ family two-component response regulator